MSIKKIRFSTLLIIGVLGIPFLPNPVKAEEKQAIVDVPSDSSLSCNEAIINVKQDLIRRGFFKGTPRSAPQVRVNKDDIQRGYNDYPPNRTITISFSTVSATDLFNSPKLMATLAAQIMAECEQVGIVGFNDYEGWRPVGYFPDNTARTFIWKDRRITPDGRLDRSKYQWGYYFSL